VPLADARTIVAQPLHPAFLRPHEHRIDVPKGIIQIKCNGTDPVRKGHHMSEFHLVIGNKNFSSWSLRPWMLMTHLGVRFREIILPLDTGAV